METTLQNKVALVTGGSQGLGAEIVRALAKAGATVMIADINEEGAKKVAQEITDAGGKAQSTPLDVSNAENCEATIQEVVTTFGQIDILVNNAGVDVTKPIHELSVKEIDRVLDINLRGPFVMSKFALAEMYKKQSGHIINIGSTAALRAWTESSAYHASKWGLRGLSQAMFTDARKNNVKVSCIIAGGMKTPFILERFPEAEPNLQDPKNVANMIIHVLQVPAESIVPEVMVYPLRETSWP